MKRIQQKIAEANKQNKTIVLTPKEWDKLVRFSIRREGGR